MGRRYARPSSSTSMAAACTTLRAARGRREGSGPLGRLERAPGGSGGLCRAVSGPPAPAMTALQETAADMRATMTDARAALAQLTPAAGAAIADYQALAREARTLVAHADTQIESLAFSVQATLDDARSVLGDDSSVRYELATTLQEITRTARALRTLADYLDQHPEALLVGKRPEPRR